LYITGIVEGISRGVTFYGIIIHVLVFLNQLACINIYLIHSGEVFIVYEFT